MIIENQIVTLTYELTCDDKQVESTSPESPFIFCTGIGMVLQRFEDEIRKLTEDSDFDFLISPEEGYGIYEDNYVFELDKSLFLINGELDTNRVYEGAVVPMLLKDGGRVNATILKINDATIRIDLNHPMAGKTLHYKGHIHSVRPATDKELELFTSPHKCGCSGGCHSECEGSCADSGDGCCSSECKNGCGGCSD